MSHSQEFWIQCFIFLAVVCLLVVFYLHFLLDFYRFVVDRWVQASILILLFALVYGQIGTGLGLHLLIWSEEPVTRFCVAVCVTLVLAVIGLNGFYLLEDEDGSFRKVMEKVSQHLSGATWWSNIPLLSFARWITAWVFLDKVLDPPAAQAEADPSNPYQLSRFLRLVRLPFLALMLLPALLPSFFENLPQFAPVVGRTQERKFLDYFPVKWDRPDIHEFCGPYLYAALIWSLGLWTGVMIVKVIILLVSKFRKATKRNRLESIVTYFVVATVMFTIMANEPVYGGRWLREHFPSTPLLKDYQGVAPGVAILAMMGWNALLSASLSLLFEGTWRQPCQKIEIKVVKIVLSLLFEERWKRAKVLGILAIVGWIAWNNAAWDSYRFEKLNYTQPIDLANATRKSYLESSKPGAAIDPPELVLDKTALEAWKNQVTPQGSSSGIPKIVIVCTSGGAIRAAYWTATVLDRLGKELSDKEEGARQDINFHKHIRMITGASGGMVGAAYYVNGLRQGALKDDWVKKIPIFSLNPVARSIALLDPVRTAFRRIYYSLDYYLDRGRVLESDWEELHKTPFIDLREQEAGGKIPSLIFSPMTVEDGRRLLISNLDLKFLYKEPKEDKEEPKEDRQDCDKPPPPLPSTRYLALNSSSLIFPEKTKQELPSVSLSAIEFFKVFQPTKENSIVLSTAARMSASFPYVSPAVYLPSQPPLRVVDAGYYDNYGVDLAAAWIFANRDWLLKNTSGILLVQIRDSLSTNDRLGYPTDSHGTYAWLLRGVQFLFSPIDGASRARYTSSAFRNDALVAGLSDYFSERTQNRDFLMPAIFELSSRTVQAIRGPRWEWPGDGLDEKIRLADSSQATEVAMSWYLTVFERQAIDMAIPWAKRPKDFRKSKEIPFGRGTSRESLKEALDLANELPQDLKFDAFPGTEPERDTLEAGRAKREERIEQLRKLAQYVRDQSRNDGTDRGRALAVIDKELARAENYERLIDIKSWWKEQHHLPKDRSTQPQ